MSGGFFGGLAQGIATGVQLDNQRGYLDLQKQYADRQAEADGRDAELHNAKMDEFKRARAANDEVAGFLSGQSPAGPQPVPVAQPAMNDAAPGLGAPSIQQPLSDPRAPGLSDVSAPQPPQMPAGQVIAKNMLTGNLLNDPEKMTAVANIYAKHGLTDKMLPWMNQAYQAKKSGIVDALPYLMAGDGENAAAMLKKSGMDIQGTPTLVDKQNQTWSFNIGGKPQEISLRQIAGMADPENWLKMQHDQQKNEADVNLKKAQTDYYKGAKTELAQAQAGRQGRLGGSAGGRGGGTSGPKVQKTVETAQGIIAVMSDGSHKLLTGTDGKPMFGTSNMKIAAGLVGKTLDPLSENKNIAGQVNDMAGQLGGGNPPASPSPAGGVRKFNPQTGKFD